MTNTATQRILLAEDDDAMRVYLERALVNAGYKVDSVDRGTAAVPLLVESDYDLLLSDIVMPEMDGIELAQHAAQVAPDMRIMFIKSSAALSGIAICRGRVIFSTKNKRFKNKLTYTIQYYT